MRVKGFRLHTAGFTLIEIIIFIVVAGVLAVGLAAVFSTAMRGAAEPGQLTQATQVAQERMELILAQKRRLGFAAFVAPAFDPCNVTPGPACTPPAGYAVASSLVASWGGDTNYKVVTVTVTGPSSTTVTAVVANY